MPRCAYDWAKAGSEPAVQTVPGWPAAAKPAVAGWRERPRMRMGKGAALGYNMRRAPALRRDLHLAIKDSLFLMKTDSPPTDAAQDRSGRASLPGLALARRGMAYVQPIHVRRLANVTAVGMFLVYAMGTLVTSTGSGHGCGNSWPLCNGRFVPEFAVSTA